MGWTDLADIAIIGVLLSLGFVWLKRRTARAVLFALVPLLVTFTAASAFKLYLTSLLFRFGLMAMFVSIVVIFHEDFRRAFESLATWRPWGKSRNINAAKIADILVETLSKLAKTKTGALIVLQGRQTIEPHCRAGVPLNGNISMPLLLSIFDPNSPGHDGAVTLAEGRVVLFGVHLPLSRNSEATGRLGTRHAAALGLAEKCDALVLVVSEETGTVSIAQDSKFSRPKTWDELRDTVAKHLRHVGPIALHRSVWEIPWLRLTGSFALAAALWLLYARPVNLILRTVEATIVYRGLPKGWEAKPPDPAKVRLTLFGPEGPVMHLDPTALAVSIDLFRITEGQQRVVLGETGVSLPPRVRIKRFEPPEIVVQAYPTIDVEAPVTVAWVPNSGRVPSSEEIRIEPARVQMKLPKSSARPKAVETEPVDPRDVQRAGKLTVKLRIPAEAPNADLYTREVELAIPAAK